MWLWHLWLGTVPGLWGMPVAGHRHGLRLYGTLGCHTPHGGLDCGQAVGVSEVALVMLAMPAGRPCLVICQPYPPLLLRWAAAGGGRAGAGAGHDGYFHRHGHLCGMELQAARRHACVSGSLERLLGSSDACLTGEVVWHAPPSCPPCVQPLALPPLLRPSIACPCSQKLDGP